MYITIDRFEGDFAVAEMETGETVNIPRCIAPDAKEGDVLLVLIDDDETERRKKKIDNLMNKLFKD